MNNKKLFLDTNLPNVLKTEDLIMYFKKMHSGDVAAREIIIYHNIRLVLSWVYKMFHENDLNDLFSIGIVGLIKAVDSYDINGAAFPSYAIKCIRNEIFMYVRNDKKNKKLLRLDGPINDDGVTLKEILCDDEMDLEYLYEKRIDNEFIRHYVNNLPVKHRQIVELYYGFNGYRTHSQQEISNKLGISQSYVSRLLNSIIKKIKNDYIIWSSDQNNSSKKIKKL